MQNHSILENINSHFVGNLNFIVEWCFFPTYEFFSRYADLNFHYFWYFSIIIFFSFISLHAETICDVTHQQGWNSEDKVHLKLIFENTFFKALEN